MLLNELNQSLDLIIQQTQHNLQFLGWIALLVWAAFFLTLLDRRLLLLGIIPRHLRGLPGILFAPLLHANFNHLFFNSIPLLVLSNFILINGQLLYYKVTLSITLLSGFGIWLLGKPGLHIGASALITGYWGYLVANLFQYNSLTTLILGFISLYYFAGIFLGVFPGKKGVSWEGHLFGLLAGVAVSYFV